jgi:hypothetical protein
MRKMILPTLTAALLILVMNGSARADLVFSFDENGNGSVIVNGGSAQTVQGALLPDLTQAGSPLELTYILGPITGPFNPGGVNDVRVYEDAAHTVLGDVVRFSDAFGDIGNGQADRLIFYSLPGSGDLADNGLPTNTTGSVPVQTTEINGSFQFSSGNNVFIGNSSLRAVPEPSSLVLCGIFGVVGFLAHRRRSVAS